MYIRRPITLHRVSKRTVGVVFLLRVPAMLDFFVFAFPINHVRTNDLRYFTSILLVALARYPISSSWFIYGWIVPNMINIPM